MKKHLTLSDMEKLNSARGFDLHRSEPGRPNQNRTGRMPSVKDYNQGVHHGLLCGDYIIPIEKE